LGKKLGKPVFAIPGSIYALNSQGCNELIRQGAILTRDVTDVLKNLGETMPNKQINKEVNTNSVENAIWEALAGETLETDKIIAATGLPAAIVLSTLSLLEIKGLVQNIGGVKYYRRQ